MAAASPAFRFKVFVVNLSGLFQKFLQNKNAFHCNQVYLTRFGMLWVKYDGEFCGLCNPI